MNILQKSSQLYNNEIIINKNDSTPPTNPLRKQLNSLDKNSNMGSINQNIENIEKSGDHILSNNQQNSNSSIKLFLRKIVFILITLIEFSILFSLILIQYISSKIELSTLASIILLQILIITIILSIITNLQPQNQDKNQTDNQNLSNHIEKPKEHIQMPTIPKISEQKNERSNAKTKKLQFAKIQIELMEKKIENTVKKLQNIDQTNIFSLPTQKINYRTKKILFFIIKSIQIIIQIVFATLSIFLFQLKDNQNNLLIISLSICIYLFCGTSLAVSWIYIKQFENNNSSKKIKNIQVQQKNIQIDSPHQAKTKVSIQHMIQVKGMECKQTLSIKQEPKVEKVQQQMSQNIQRKSISANYRSEIDKQNENNCKLQLKRSVLKSSKKRLNRHGQEQMEQGIERRKVEINSKKIQYFQYSVISPSHSIIDEQQISKNKIINKSKYNVQRITYLKNKIQNESRLLRNKIQARQLKAKSLGNLQKYKRQQIIDESFKVDYFY